MKIVSRSSSLPQDPAELRAFLEAAAAAPGPAREKLRKACSAQMQRLSDEGRATYGDLGLGSDEAAAALARVALTNLVAEIRRNPRAVPPLFEILDGLVLCDVWLSEALLRGSDAAWGLFSTTLERALRQVSRQSSGIRAQLEELEEDLLSVFFGGDKVRTFRATAPIGAWARQVVLNLLRQRLQSWRSRTADLPLSGLTDPESGSPQLEPETTLARPEEIATQREWRKALTNAVPLALQGLDRDERRMLADLPVRRITQVELAQELGVSPFKMNRWYKEVRERFLRRLTHHLRLAIGLAGDETEELVAYLAQCLERDAESAQFTDRA